MNKVTNNKDMLEAVKKAKKGETIIFDESGNIFGLDFIINKTSKRECLLCKTNLDKDIGEGKWHIPLCKKHRLEENDKLQKELNKFKSKESRFEEVYHSKYKEILLESKEGYPLVFTWGSEESLNDFEYFERENNGQFWINGDFQPVELLINNEWVRFDDVISGRFLKK